MTDVIALPYEHDLSRTLPDQDGPPGRPGGAAELGPLGTSTTIVAARPPRGS